MGIDDTRQRELIVEGLEQYELGGTKALESFLSGLGDSEPRVRAGMKSLRSIGMLERSQGDRLRIPDRLGEFKIVRQLGVGGMGLVLLAEQEGFGRTVALKLIRPEFSVQEASRQRFLREVEAAGRLSHPSIVQVLTVGEESGHLYFAMEHVRGASLAELLAELEGADAASLSGRDLLDALLKIVPGAEVGSGELHSIFRGSWVMGCVRIAREVGGALAHAHDRGVLHRDVKPSNILLTAAGRVVLLDFGLAALQGAGTITKTGSWLGSLPYMPPEAFDPNGCVLGVEADVYGLGATLYELLTLHQPFRSDCEMSLEGDIRSGRVPPLTSLNRAAGRETEIVVKAAMDIEPSRRYRSASGFRSDLDNVLAKRPIRARRGGPLLRAWRWTQRHPELAGVVSACVLLLLVGSIYFAISQKRAASHLATANERLQDEQARVELNLTAAMESVWEQVRLLNDPSLRRKEFRGLRDSLIESVTGYLDELLEIERSGEPFLDVRGRAQYCIGVLLADLGLYEKARLRFLDSVEMRELLVDVHREGSDSTAEIRELKTLAWSWIYVGFTSAYSGKLVEVRKALEGLGVALEALDGLGARDDQPLFDANRFWLNGLLAMQETRLDDAHAAFEAARLGEQRAFDAADTPWKVFDAHHSMANTNGFWADVQLRRGELSHALSLAEQGVKMALAGGEDRPEEYWSDLESGRSAGRRGEILLAMNEPVRALESFSEAQGYCDRWREGYGDFPRLMPELARVAVGMAEAMAAAGRPMDARQKAEDGLAAVEAGLEAGSYLALDLGLIGSLHRRTAMLSEPDRAREHLECAQSLVEQGLALVPDHPLLGAELEKIRSAR